MACMYVAGARAQDTILFRSDPVPAGMARDVQYTVRVQNAGADVVTGAVLHVFAPVPRTSGQQVASVTASAPAEWQNAPRSNAWLRFALPDVPPYGVQMISVRAALVMAETPWPAPEPAADFLAEERFVESGDEKIAALAANLRRDTAAATAQAIHAWIVQNIGAESYVAGERGARWALAARKGDCTEKAFLFAALGRAAGVPARVLAGFVCSQSRILHPAEYHNWAEFYDGTAWQTADPDRNVFRDGRDYVAVRVLGPGREEWIQGSQLVRVDGAGLVAVME
jgi:transglutaminase-like putative cysteine protease